MARRIGFWQAVKSFHYGEAVLWALFMLGFLHALMDSNDQGGVMAAVSALAAIGVRTTRTPKPRDTDAE